MLCVIVGFALLTGNPISGALLRSPHYEWQNPILFASVSPLSHPYPLPFSLNRFVFPASRVRSWSRWL